MGSGSDLYRSSVPGAGQDEEIELVTVSDPAALAPSDVSAIALDFKVLHPVVITRLGVFPGGTRAELRSNVTVKLLQLDQEVRATRPPSRTLLSWKCTAWGQLEGCVVTVHTLTDTHTHRRSQSPSA